MNDKIKRDWNPHKTETLITPNWVTENQTKRGWLWVKFCCFNKKGKKKKKHQKWAREHTQSSLLWLMAAAPVINADFPPDSPPPARLPAAAPSPVWKRARNAKAPSFWIPFERTPLNLGVPGKTAAASQKRKKESNFFGCCFFVLFFPGFGL